MGLLGKKKAEEKAEEARRAREERLQRISERGPRAYEEDDYEECAPEEERPDLVLPEGSTARYLQPAIELAPGPVEVSPDSEWPSDTVVQIKHEDNNESDAKKKKSSAGESADDQLSLFDDLTEADAMASSEYDDKKAEAINKFVNELRQMISRDFGPRLIDEKEQEKLRNEIPLCIAEYIKVASTKGEFPGTAADTEHIVRRTTNLILGLGPLEDLFDKGYTEIMVSRWDRIFVEKSGKMVDSGVKFGSEEELRSVIVQMCGRIGKTINKTNTRVDGDLADGSRFNAIFPPSSPDGANLTIRRFSDHKIQPDEYLSFGSADRRMMYFLQKMVESGATMIASGGTGSGKTTLLNLLASFIPDDLSVLTIEDSLELKLPCSNWRRRLTRQSTEKDKAGAVSATDLVKNALRERPDRIVIGEIRDGTMVDFLDAANSGHDGCLTTVHANSPRGLTSRIISLFKKANIEGYGTDDIKRLYADAVHLIVQIKRYPDHTRKISHISQVVGYGAEAAEELGEAALRPNDVYIKDIFRWKPDGGRDEAGRLTGKFTATGYVPEALLELASDNGIEIDRNIFDESVEWNEAGS